MGIKTVQKVPKSGLSERADLRRKAKVFRATLMRWARGHGRSFPWRETSDPYAALVAELMLQRTRSDQVVPVYRRFMTTFPTVLSLAGAPLDEVRGVLRPLGLAFRARLFGELARAVVRDHEGNVPVKAEDAVRLPGAGPYTATAVDVFLGRRRIPLIDANVARVIGRVFRAGRADWRHATAEERRVVVELAALCMGRSDPRAYHYALLDFAAKVCAPRKPACPDCPMHRVRICAYCKEHTRAGPQS